MFSPDDKVKIKDSVREELSVLYRESKGMSGMCEKDMGDIYMVLNPPYDGSNLRVCGINNPSTYLSLNVSRWELIVREV